MQLPDGSTATWSATVPPLTPNAWAASHAYALNALVAPGNGFYYKATSVVGSGTSALVAPSFPTIVGETVVDNPGANQVVWTCMGAATSSSALTIVHAFASGDCPLEGAYQVEALLSTSGGTVPCFARVLVAATAYALV